MYFVSEELKKYGNMWKSALLSINQDENDHALAPSFNKIFQILIYGSQSNLSEVAKRYFILWLILDNRKKELVILMAWGLERFISSLTDNYVLPANLVHRYIYIGKVKKFEPSSPFSLRRNSRLLTLHYALNLTS